MRIKMPAVRIAQADAEMQQQHSDVLTCGTCQKPFALGDIVKFIQHKVLACNKENYLCDPNGPNLESGDSDDGGVGVLNSRRPSISAPIKKISLGSSGREGRLLCTPSASPEGEDRDRDPRCSTPKRAVGRPPLPLNLAEAADEDELTKRTDSTPPHSSPDEGPCKKLRTEVSDAQSNTTNSEPSNYVCSTCNAKLHSAWRLVQHVQNSHGINIYVEPATTGLTSSISSSPGTSSNPGKNQSGSSTSSSTSSSGCSSSSNVVVPGTPLSLAPPSRLGITTSSPIEPPIPLHNPFTVGGILRLPLEPPRHHQFPPNSLGSTSGSLFARPSSHSEHHFRMDQLVSEQFRLSQHHSLNLAAAVAAASGVPPPHPPFVPPPSDRPSPILPTTSVGRTPVAPPPPSIALSLEPQLDFYSQRLRQLAGTTSPGPNPAGNSSPSSRKLTPPFTSPTSSLQPPSTISSAALNNNNNSSTNNNNINSLPQSPSHRARSHTPPTEQKSQSGDTPTNDRASLPPRSSPQPVRPTDFTMAHVTESMDTSDGNRIHACDYCGKKFRFHSNLIVHRRSHTGEKPYKCTVCNHACSQSSKLKRHMRVHRRARTGTPVNDDGTHPNGTGLNSNNDQGSNEGSVGTGDEDEDEDEDMEEDEDEEEEEDDEDEEMELEDEEGDEDDDIGGDAPEDLTTKSNSSTPPTVEHKGSSSPPNADKVPSGSLVGELMDKYGLSNIQQYSEAYKQALQESVGAHHIMRKDDLLHRTHLLSDNNNCKQPHRLENGLLEKSAAALRFREEFAKNMMSGQPPLELVAGHPGLFGSPFDNPFDPSKRVKMERDGSIGRGDREGLYPSMWLPAMTAHHREQMFGGNGSESDIMKDKCKTGGSPCTSASLAAAAAAAAALNLGLPSQNMKKESRRNDTCEYCGKVFKNCSNLTVHRRSHTGEKPYKCELCSYACAQSSKLTRHMKTHGRMGKDVYRCRFCEMPFSVPSTLEKHMRKCVVNQNIKVEHIMPSMLSGDEDSAASTPKDATPT